VPSTIDTEIFEQYASEAAFLWSLRDAAVGAARHDLGSLCGLDERIEAHLDGLRLAGEDGWRLCVEVLEDAAPEGVFVAMVLAIERPGWRDVARILDVGGGEPRLARGIVAALGWAPFERVRSVLLGLLFPRCSSALHVLGVAACAAHRQDPGAALADAVLSSDPRLRARALRAAGELGRADLRREVRAELGSEDEGCRFAAAWSAAIFGTEEALPTLQRLAGDGGPYAERAAATAARRMDPSAATGWLRALSGSPGGVRAALAGAAALGDPALVPWLCASMADREIARAAVFAFATITGADLAREKLRAAPPEGFDDGPDGDAEIVRDPDHDLPWPDVEAIERWWTQRRGDLRPGTRYLLGKPITEAWLGKVLVDGRQPARAAAAVELQMRRGRALFEVRAPGERQRRALSSP
jgi:uncharacterized protein (TIGR02270 family)